KDQLVKMLTGRQRKGPNRMLATYVPSRTLETWRFGMTKRRTDWGSLIAGLVFLGLAVAFIVRGSGGWEFSALWAVPVLVVGLGSAVAVRVFSRKAAREMDRVEDASGPTEERP